MKRLNLNQMSAIKGGSWALFAGDVGCAVSWGLIGCLLGPIVGLVGGIICSMGVADELHEL